MILLTVIAVGLLTLSTISLRSTGQASAASIARANARLAMMMALGDLQASMGPDKSVSAPASSVFDTTSSPHLTGTWTATPTDTWRWTPTINGAPSFSEKKNRFSRWLVSAPTPADAEDFNFASQKVPTGTEAVTLVGSTIEPVKDAADVETTVVATKVKVGSTTGGKTPSGKYGWAVFDESTKAVIDLGDPATTQPAGIEIASRSVPSRERADVLDTKLSSLKTPKNLISLETASVAGGKDSKPEFRKRFHDFTTGSLGLLTNTSTGGLKTDLTSLFEPQTLPSGAFVAPTAVSPYQSSFNVTWGAPRWSYIREHYRKYKNISAAGTGELSYNLQSAIAKDLKLNGNVTGNNINIGDPAGNSPSPDTERLLPVVAKFQLVFSIVSHRHTYPGRADYFNGKLGVNNYGVPHLVYDPVITLYNPYDVTLSLAKTRIRIWDPPVAFRLIKTDKKTGASSSFRDPNGAGVLPNSNGFWSLAQMQIDKQTDNAARRCFTLLLTDGTSQASGATLRLKPGEVKVFSPRVQDTWDWQWETTNGPNVFFDYATSNNFGNVDGRSKSGVGVFGVETVPGWAFRAGLQVDHMALGGRNEVQRWPNSEYDFEIAEKRNDGFVTMRNSDELQVEVKPWIAPNGAAKQFQVDILAGANPGVPTFDAGNTGVKVDTLRSFSFTFTGSDPSADMSEDPANPVIKSEKYLISELLQDNSDRTKGGKKAIAMLEMSARTTWDDLTDSKPYLYNNPVVEGADQNTIVAGLGHQAYDLRLIRLTSLDVFPRGIAVDPDTYRGYFGTSGSTTKGSSFMPTLHVPVAPAASLGDLIHANMASGSKLPRVWHPFGNSRAHPLIASDKVGRTGTEVMLDHSYLLNDALWDGYYFSSMTAYEGGAGKALPTARTAKEVVTGVLDGSEPALNNRLAPISQGEPAKQADKILALTDVERSRQLAKYVGVKAPFNVNSTSLDAWCAVLMSLRDRNINGVNVKSTGRHPNSVTTVSNSSFGNGDRTPFVRTGKPLAGPGGGGVGSGFQWAGYNALSDEDLKELAKQIIVEIKKSGVSDSAPPFTVGEFVNRRPGSSVHANAGLLQTAIDVAKMKNGQNINADALGRDSKKVSVPIGKRSFGVQNTSVMNGESAEGAPTMLTQGDLMTALAPVVTVRGDTFKIRSYGEATAPNGTTVLARAWCETIVQRVPDFVDGADVPETVSLTSPANIKFGRRFNIVSFRWLSENEL